MKEKAFYLIPLNQSISEWHTLAIFDDVLATSEKSSLVGYTPLYGNNTCDASDFLVFESSKGNLWIQYPHSGGSSGEFLPDGVDGTDSGTAMAVTSIYARINATTDARMPQITMYLVYEGTLVEITGTRGKAWRRSGPGLRDNKFVDSGAQLAAMSRVTDGLIYTEVLVTRSDGGVAMAYYDQNQQHWLTTERVEGMENVLPLSPIAATQAGHVYALENGSQIVEWKLVAGKHPPEFERVAVVDTHS
ncbi:hypothetical protein UCDDS831_g08721 [Diplodia seriata]|uniref:Fucose-specific lectin n=1 Tax=Diplodia seriata TaxID=420778 RepID=A0A0G2DUB0_9PEZI|nr:hypothetical protein UCDDS831_g08721 [Diplodia seriata]